MNPAERIDRRRAGQPAVDLFEEAVALLRRTPTDAFFAYLLGAVPFYAALLLFVSDMSRNAFAWRTLPEASLLVALLYLWMKCWQSVFAARLRALLTERPDAPWTLARIGRLVATQVAWQPWGFIFRALAAQIIVPYAWAVSFFQNVTVLGDGTRHENSTLAARAWTQARLWPMQAHKALAILWIFGLFVWINVVAVLGLTPVALRMFFGIATAFSQSIESYFNTTFFGASFALTALLVDPLWKAIFVLRCFRGDALRTGEDLVVELRQAQSSRRAPLAAAVALLLTCASVGAADAPSAAPVSAASAAELDARIGEVLARREYAWRAPRELSFEQENVGWFQGWMRGIGKALLRAGDAAGETVGEFFRWIWSKLFPSATPIRSAASWDWLGATKALLVLLAVACAVLVAWALWRVMQRSRSKLTLAVPARAVPDLRADDLAADQLPEDGWLALAREHAGRGELQLALRAAWLAGLAHLGERQLLSIARHKSNRDYDRELHRRARTRDELLGAFGENLRLFERSWYGRHSVGAEDFTVFEGNLATIRKEAQ